MQRVTKYRTAIGLLIASTVGCATYAFAAKHECAQLQSRLAQATQLAEGSAKQVHVVEEKVSAAKSLGIAERTTLTQALDAFSQQVETCAVLKEQLHIKE